jgi:RNA polymerase sigma-70 factor (ECF subfamily)
VTIEDRIKALMTRSLAGDVAANHELLTSLATHLRTFFRRRVHSEVDIEDLLQETLLAIHVKRETFDTDELVTAWVYAIARHKLIDWYRRRSARIAMPLEDAGDLFTDGAYEDATAAQDLVRLLQELPQKQAAAIRCMKLEGLSAAQTAVRTGQSVSAVKVGVHRGLRTLATRLRGLLP